MILAGVSINTVLGDDGIIQKAKEAAEATKRASAEEEMNRLVLEYQLAKNDETLESFLKEKVTEGRIDGVTDNGDGTITITKKVEGKDYTITVKKPVAPTPSIKIKGKRVVANEDGTGENLGEASTRKGTTLYIMIESTISGGTTTVSPEVPYAVTENGTYKFTVTGTVNGETSTKTVSVTVNQYSSKYKIGDYVNYTPNTEKSESTVNQSESGTSEQKVAKDATLKWRILNIDEAKGTVDLVSAAPTSSTVKFYGALGYHNGPYIMNKICEELYSNSTLNVKARNINLLDMEKHLTTPGITARNGYSSAVQYGATKTYTDNYSYYPLLYDGQKGAGVNVTAENARTIAQPKKDSGNDPYEESVETTSPLTDKTYKKADNSVLTVTQTYYNISINETNYGDAAKVLNNSNYYWVAARYVGTSSNYARFGLRRASADADGDGVFYSDDDSYTSGWYGLRPVVSLSSSILSETKDASGAWNLK